MLTLRVPLLVPFLSAIVFAIALHEPPARADRVPATKAPTPAPVGPMGKATTVPCPAQDNTNLALVRQRMPKGATASLSSGGCAAIGGGMIGLRARRVRAPMCQGGDEGVELQVQLELQVLGPDGKGRSLTAPADLATLLVEETPCPAGSHRYVRVAGAGDLDGDGAPEVVLVLSQGGHEELDKTEVQIWTVRGSALTRYAKDPKLPRLEMPAGEGATALAESLVRDLDGDGRPELLHPGPYQGTTMPVRGLFDTLPAVGPLFSFRARPDGSFSSDDAIAQAKIRRYCGNTPLGMKDPPTADPGATNLTERIVRRVVCARVYGAQVQALLGELQRECPAWQAAEFMDDEPDPAALAAVKKKPAPCPQWLVDLAKVTPPLLLRPAR